ncbi:MAG: methyltransferase domain-containing protein [Candidatus Pacearchaeota archaeon]
MLLRRHLEVCSKKNKIPQDKFFFEKIYSKKNFKFYFDKDEEVINEILKHKKSGKVLDLGCGEGGNSLFLAEKGFEVVCVDISKTAIKKIKEEIKRRKIKLGAIVTDLEKFKFKENYDIIIATGVFHLISKKKVFKILEEIKNHTKPRRLNIFKVLLHEDPTEKENDYGYYFKSNELKKIYFDWKIFKYREYKDYDEKERQFNRVGFLVAGKV